MATTTTPTPIAGLNAQDQAFMNGFYDTIKDSAAALTLYNGWGTTLSKKPTYDGKLAYIRNIITNLNLASKYRTKLPDLGVKWLADSNPGVVDSKGDAFSTDFYKGIISGDAKTQTANSTTLKTAKTKIATESAKLANPNATPAELATIVADTVNGSTTKPYTPADLTKAITTSPSADLYKPGSMTAAELKTKYGAITDPNTGEPLFSDDYFTKLAAATTLAGTQGFNDTLSKVASKVLTSQKGSNYLVQSDADKANALSDLLKNPDKIASGTKSLFKPGITGLLPKGSYKDANGNFAYTGGQIDSKDMTDFTQSYNPNKGVYLAPTLDASGKLVSNPTSPYSNILNSMLSNSKDPFASGYTSSLDSRHPAALTSTQLASLNKPLTANTTASDLVKLVNTAGEGYDPTNKAGSTLSPALRQLYQTQTLSDDTVKAKPGVPDPTKMTVPKANFLDPNGDLLYGDIAGGDLTNTPMGGDSKTAEESAFGFTPDTTLKNVPGADITGDSGTLTKPDITDKATADALHKVEQDRIAKEAADKAEAAKKALYYNADGTLTELGFYTNNPTGNYQDYLNKIAADKVTTDTTPTDTGGITSLPGRTKTMRNTGGFKPELDMYGQNSSERIDAAFRDAYQNEPYWGTAIKNGTLSISDDKKQELVNSFLASKEAANEAYRQETDRKNVEDVARLNFADKNGIDYQTRWTPEFSKLFYASNPSTVVGGLGTDSIKSGMGTDSIKSGMGTDAEIGAGLLNQNPDGTVQNTALLPPGKLYTPQLDAAITQQRQGPLGIAGNPNVGGFTTAGNMNTNATGVGAPITSLLTPNTGAAGTPNIQNTGVANQQVAPTYTQANYIPPGTRNGVVFQNALKADPSLKAMADWSAAQDASR